MEKSFSEEKDYLKNTLNKFEEIIADTELRLEALPKIYKDNPALLENLLTQFSHKFQMLTRTKNKPYFARINFKNSQDNTIEECYIGKVGVSDDDNKLITVDWRAPISSMYYDSNIGPATYDAPQGLIHGNLLVKRQYDIENKELKGFQDVDTVSNDEILKPYLGVNADNRLKNIVATIQSEQNEIIREKLDNNLIIQGVAGSGKTTVALHRIAYLVYNNMKTIRPDQYLVIGPSKFFVNYISGVLPDLDVDNVSQLTFAEIVQDLLNEDFALISDEEKLIKSISDPSKMFYEKLRTSMLYKQALDTYLLDFDKTVVPNLDFTIKGYKILPHLIMEKVYDKIKDSKVVKYEILARKLDRTYLILEKYIETHYEKIMSNIDKQFYEKTKTLSKEEIRKEFKNKEYIEKELSNNCKQSLKKYFSAGYPKILTLYANFLKNINLYFDVDKYKMDTFSKKTLSNVKNKKIEFEDLGALMYLYYRIYGSSTFEKYRHTVIDEAQDLGEFNFYVLKKLMSKCTFSIFGDLAQSIYQYRSIENWEDVIIRSFDGMCDIKYLSKSYRTTTEIMNSANHVTKFIGLHTAKPVIRHGVEVQYNKIHGNKNLLILNYINEYIEKEYCSIAIICKDENETMVLSNFLKENGIETNCICNSDTEYRGGICTITSYLAKGLEFDGVIIADASETCYDSSKIIDMKLLYVAMTRPLHELKILYSDEISKPLKEEV